MKSYSIYVKQAPSGILYLGRTSSDNPEKYLGSGKYWMNHISSHGYTSKDIKTWILDEVETHDELRELGRYYSKLFNVAKSDKWANLKDEEGEGFGTGDNHPFRINPELNPCIGRTGNSHPLYGKKGKDNPNYGQKRPNTSLKLAGNKNGRSNVGKKRADLSERNRLNNPTNNREVVEKIVSTSGIRVKDHFCPSCGVYMNRQNYYRWGHDRHEIL
jgi:hypothetical protein